MKRLLLALFLAAITRLPAQQDSAVVVRNDSVTVRLENADLRLAIQALAPFLDRPVMFGNIGDVRITLETPRPVPREALPGIIRGMLQSYGLVLGEGDGFYTVGPVQSPASPQERPSTGPVQLFVIHIRHARAADVAATVNALYGQSSALGEVGAPGPTLPDALRSNLVPPVGTPEPTKQAPVVQQPAQLSGEVTIIPDARTNSLLVRASEVDFELIRAAVDQLDIRPLQVLIEVVIAEVRRDRSLSYGVEAILPPQTVGGSDTQISGSTTGLGTGDFVLKVMKLGKIDLTATLAAAASRGDVTILSRPVVLAANNETAEILVGSQRPFVQVQRSLPTDAPIRDQVVQFKDVGTRLTVRPTISDDGYVTLSVAQEVNAATAEVAFDAPVISTRTIQTQLLVMDGHTAVLGGLTDKQRDVTRAGVPILSSLPLLGGLFGRQVRQTTETELFVFLTPRVIRTDEQLDDASRSAGDRTRNLRDGVPNPSHLPASADTIQGRRPSGPEQPRP
jgi:general secretion pathway protein D